MSLFEFAIDPAVMSDFSDCRLIASHMGLRSRRVISAYPSKKRWKGWTLEQAALIGAGKREFAKHEELIRSLERFLVETDRAYNHETGWLPNALEQQRREQTRFHGIVATENTDDRIDVLTIPDINGENRVWNPSAGGLNPLWVTDELRGDVQKMGERFWELVARSFPDLAERLQGECPISRVDFRDRYLRSPLAMRLILEVIRSLGMFPCSAGRPFETLVTTIFMTGSIPRTPPSLIQHDWIPGFPRERLLESIAREVPLRLQLEELERRESVHFRDLTIVWADGARWTIILDEGFGFLEPDSPCRFDFGDDPETQGRQLLAVEFRVRRRSYAGTLFLLGGVELPL